MAKLRTMRFAVTWETMPKQAPPNTAWDKQRELFASKGKAQALVDDLLSLTGDNVGPHYYRAVEMARLP